jgi:hypothetical protein
MDMNKYFRIFVSINNLRKLQSIATVVCSLTLWRQIYLPLPLHEWTSVGEMFDRASSSSWTIKLYFSTRNY